MKRKLSAFVALASATILIACGGGGGGGGGGDGPIVPPPPPPPPPPPVTIGFDPGSRLELENLSTSEQEQVVVLPNGDALAVYVLNVDNNHRQQLVAKRISTSGAVSLPEVISEPLEGNVHRGLKLKVAPDGLSVFAVFVQAPTAAQAPTNGRESVLAIKYDNGATPAWGPAEEVAKRVGNLSQVDMAFDPDPLSGHRPSIVWREFKAATSSTLQTVKVAVSKRSGATWDNAHFVYEGNPDHVNVDQYDLNQPRLAFVGGKRVVSMEVHDRKFANQANNDAMAVFIEDTATGVWNGQPYIFPGDVDAGGQIKNSDLAQSPNGGLAIAFEFAPTEGTGRERHVFASQLNTTSLNFGPLLRISAANSEDAELVGLTLDDNNQALVVWTDGQDQSLFAARVKLLEFGASIQSKVLENNSNPVQKVSPLVRDQAGRGTVTWLQRGAQDADGLRSLYSASYDPEKNEFSAPQLVESSNDQIGVSILSTSVSAKGRAYVVWKQSSRLYVNNNKGPVN